MNDAPWDVITCGEAMAVFNTDPHRPLQWGDRVNVTFAGAESNVAIGLSRLGHRVRWDSVLGRDRFGALIQKTLRGEGVGIEGVRVVEENRTATMVKYYHPIAEPTVEYYRQTSAFRTAGPCCLDSTPLAPARVLFLTGITPALSPAWADWCLQAMAGARKRGYAVWFDPNYRHKLWSGPDARHWYLQALPFVDVLLCGLSEGQLLTAAETPSAIGAALRELSDAEIVLKTGHTGAIAFASSSTVTAPPARQITPIDPIGAGDGFAAGYLSAWLDGLKLIDRLERGNAVGAMACLASGDWEGLPNRGELSRFLAQIAGADR